MTNEEETTKPISEFTLEQGYEYFLSYTTQGHPADPTVHHEPAAYYVGILPDRHIFWDRAGLFSSPNDFPMKSVETTGFMLEAVAGDDHDDDEATAILNRAMGVE